MSYVDDRFVLLSLGCSCQTAGQIDANIAAIAAALESDHGRHTSAYFDWLIAPSEAVVRLLGDDLPVPAAIEEVGLICGRPRYLRYGSLFYHEFLQESGGYGIEPGQFAGVAAKFDHLARKTRALVAEREPIFLWSNTQMNLDLVLHECDGLDLVLTDDTIDRLVAAADRWSNRQARYLFVSSDDRCDVRRDHERVELRTMPITHATWLGSTEDWCRLLASGLPALTAKSVSARSDAL